ncbi:MAG: hypothetical protein HC827_17870 [Cyanobacteria bacterium RM1_2_2]|nr:hypothetical protein [Cyanobacteria bacterium RM1_2_2]
MGLDNVDNLDNLDNKWQTVVAAALVGLERQPFTCPTATGKLGQLLAQFSEYSSEQLPEHSSEQLPKQSPKQSPEASLLLTAATLALYRRAGWLPESSLSSQQSDKAALPSDMPRCSVRAVACLQQILRGQYAQCLPEWLTLATSARQRVPELYLPELLDLGRQQRGLRAALLPVLGQRGRWLAQQNPDWSYAAELPTEENWETGSASVRLLYLLELRGPNPDRARALLQATWSQEAASDRAKFLETLRTGLSMADEPFLMEVLNDRSREVRRIAADLLSGLPESRLCQTVADYATRYLTLTTDAQTGQAEPPQCLRVDLPPDLDPVLIRCGIEPKPPKRSANLGEKAWWLLQILGATPLNTWHTHGWHQDITPATLMQLAKHHEWEAVLLEGWALAATRQQNAVWLEALLARWIAKGTVARTVLLPELGLEALLDGLPADRQSAVLTGFLQSGQGGIADSLTIWLLRHSREAWSIDLGEMVLEQLEVHFGDHPAPTNLAWELRSALKEFARFMPVSLTGRAVELQARLSHESAWRQSVEEFLSLLQFRTEMEQSFRAE